MFAKLSCTLCTFNSRPHKEVDITQRQTCLRTLNFQFTTSQGGRRYSQAYRRGQTVFQFTTSQGGRHVCSLIPLVSWTFQFTTSQGGRPQRDSHSLCYTFFQFTTSQGGRRSCTNNTFKILFPFNSRPHKEVDLDVLTSSACFRLFQFTTSQGGRLRINSLPFRMYGLSIHDLTRRSTYPR